MSSGEGTIYKTSAVCTEVERGVVQNLTKVGKLALDLVLTEGVKRSENSADIICAWPRRRKASEGGGRDSL